MIPPRPAKPDDRPDIGALAENLVAQWLLGQGWHILHRRWRCRWGELDLIVRQNLDASVLAFVEVKARSRGNWDENGLLAITPQKRAKLWQTAQIFLADYPHLAELPCRFDVALVSCQQLSVRSREPSRQAVPIELGQPVFEAGYRWVIHQYIAGAFECD